MPLPSGRKASRFLCGCVLAGCAASGALALEPSAPDDAAINLDQAVQALKDEALQFNRDALLAEDEFLYPRQTRLTLYVSNRIPNLLLETLSISLDGGPATQIKYDDTDARALLKKGALQRVLRANVERGAHRIRVTFTGKLADGDAEGDPISGTLEAVVDKTPETSDVELQIVRVSRRQPAAIKVREWRSSEP